MDYKKANFSHNQILPILDLYPFNLTDIHISNLSGIANNNYHIKGPHLDISLKVYSHGQSDKKKIEKELEAMVLLRKRRLNIPEILPGKNKKLLQEYKGFYLCVTNFIYGKVFDKVKFTASKMFDVGKLVAQIQTVAKELDISSFKSMNMREEFKYISRNLDTELSKRGYQFDLDIYNNNLDLVNKIISKLDNASDKQFLHKDIWPWNLIDAKDGIYLLDFNDWAIGSPIIEICVPLLEFGMFKSDVFDMEVAKNIIRGYESIRKLAYTPSDIWEKMLYMCYLFFPYNVIQAEDKFESEIYLKRINTLLSKPDIIMELF